jgi:hypothetical protein
MPPAGKIRTDDGARDAIPSGDGTMRPGSCDLLRDFSLLEVFWKPLGLQPWNTGSDAQSPFSTGAGSWQPIHVAAMVA